MNLLDDIVTTIKKNKSMILAGLDLASQIVHDVCGSKPTPKPRTVKRRKTSARSK